MYTARQSDDEQTKLWNGPAGHAWVDEQELLDRMFRPIEDLLAEAVSGGAGSRVLDVGCGTGSTTLAAARLLGTKGRCVGIDISDPMIAAARSRAKLEGVPADFIGDNAQTHAFEPASFDMIISRFGVMFFNDPVEAFANLRRAANDDAELKVVAWRSTAENPFMTTAERAAASIMPDFPARRPNAQGQFGFADEHRVRRILKESGWTEIDIQPIDVACAMSEEDLDRYLARLGPLGVILHGVDERERSLVLDTVRTAFDPYVHGTEVRFTAACWSIRARASSA